MLKPRRGQTSQVHQEWHDHQLQWTVAPDDVWRWEAVASIQRIDRFRNGINISLLRIMPAFHKPMVDHICRASQVVPSTDQTHKNVRGVAGVLEHS